MPSHLITNARILDGTGREPFAGSVRVEDNRIGLPGELGVVKASALADLLLVDGDPLADIAVLQDRSALRMIMKDGAIYKGGAQGSA